MFDAVDGEGVVVEAVLVVVVSGDFGKAAIVVAG